MRAIYRCEMKMKAELDDAGIECFLPIEYKEEQKPGKKKRIVKVPAISSLIFVRSTRPVLQEFKSRFPRLQYICNRINDAVGVPLIVPDDQMEAFIRIYESKKYQILENEDELLPGVRVRITSGSFAGTKGTIQRVKGKKNKMFVVTIDGIASIMTKLDRSTSMEVIKEDDEDTKEETENKETDKGEARSE